MGTPLNVFSDIGEIIGVKFEITCNHETKDARLDLMLGRNKTLSRS